jgi:hypothetical protein
VFGRQTADGALNMAIMFNLPKPTGHVMYQQFDIQQQYVLPTLCLCVLCLSEYKERSVSYLQSCSVFINEMKRVYCAVRTGYLKLCAVGL